MSLGEMLVIAVLVLVFFDADQLPELMRKAGRFYGQIRSASDDLRRTFNAEVARVDADKRRAELMRRREEIQRLRTAQRPPDEEGAPEPVARPDPLAALRAARGAPAEASAEASAEGTATPPPPPPADPKDAA